MSEEENIKTPDSLQNNSTKDIPESKPIKSNEKIKCDCGKVVMRKNMPVHELTNHHMNFIKETTKIAEPKEMPKVPEKKTDVGIKIKGEFEALNTKLDELYDCVMDIYDFLMPEDIGEENIAPEK
jgi:hypothetical protein